MICTSHLIPTTAQVGRATRGSAEGSLSQRNRPTLHVNEMLFHSVTDRRGAAAPSVPDACTWGVLLGH